MYVGYSNGNFSIQCDDTMTHQMGQYTMRLLLYVAVNCAIWINKSHDAHLILLTVTQRNKEK